MGILPQIRTSCQQFLQETTKPLVKKFPNISDDVAKIKLRHRKISNTTLGNLFSRGFGVPSLMERALFVGGVENEISSGEDYYIFLPDGYRYIYNTTVKSAVQEYSLSIKQMKMFMGGEDIDNLVPEILKHQYSTENLDSAIESGVEIMIFNISHIYACRVGAIDYDQLKELINA